LEGKAMTTYEIKKRILYNQHITNKSDKLTVIHDLCGVQAQFMTNAYHAVKIRCRDELSQGTWGEGLVKNWTIRGTVHVFSADDLPLFLHNSQAHYLHPHDTADGDYCISSERNKQFADYIIKLIGEGISERESLKAECFKIGMTARECESVFDQWGGTIRRLAERGFICYKVQEKKAFILCPPFVPIEKEKAKLEIARRYFLNYAPATIKDAAYFSGMTQANIKEWLNKLPVTVENVDGTDYFYINNGITDYPEILGCILLAGFDQLMLGYNKQSSLFLPQEHLREIFNLAGIVMPAILLDGRVIGKWKKKNKNITFTLFESVNKESIKQISDTAGIYWNDIKKTEWV
jgi:hypothetical protein